MRIRWALPAVDDLTNIRDYLDRREPRVAQKTIITIYRRIRSLRNAPNRFRPGHNPQTREMSLSPLP